MDDTSPTAVDDRADADRVTRRRWLVPTLVAAAVAVVTGGAFAGAAAGWFEGDADVSTALPPLQPGDRGVQDAESVPSDARALTAAVLTHIPSRVTVVWSTGEDGSPFPKSAPAGALDGSITSLVLMRVGKDEFALSVVTRPGGGEVGPLGDGLVTRDKQGRPVSDMVAGGAHGSSTLIVESANPSPDSTLPLSSADLQAILADPLVGIHTDQATIARSRSLPGYTTSPPALSWEM